MSNIFNLAPSYMGMQTPKTRYCARCDRMREYTEQTMEDGDGWNQYCTECGCIVGMRLPIKQHERWVIDPYQKYDDEPMTVDEYMHMKGV